MQRNTTLLLCSELLGALLGGFLTHLTDFSTGVLVFSSPVTLLSVIFAPSGEAILVNVSCVLLSFWLLFLCFNMQAALVLGVTLIDECSRVRKS